MSTFVIGDVQGCFDTLQVLLSQIGYASDKDTLIFAGDMVNRGPKSLDTLRAIIALGSRARCVLGNHDLYLLMCACGGRPIRPKKDTFEDVLHAPDASAILLWLAQQPLMLQADGHVIVHAGLLPQWSIATAQSLADAFSSALKAVWNPSDLRHAKAFFESLWSDFPNQWRDNLSPTEKFRVTVNAMTRLRMLDTNGGMDFSQKTELDKAPAGYIPWFRAPNRQSQGTPLVCGHWSTLGLMIGVEVSHIDTGCVWGRQLTALRLPDRVYYQATAVEAFLS
jgi:bis(5'-nucleosyl)-tetraphosphatase (symmetrical)